MGRWIGGLLGYKPFFREYTTDWDFAVAKMKGSFFQRHLVHDAFAAEKAWPAQVALEASSTPENAEYEPWVQDMSPKPLVLSAPRYEKGVFVENSENVQSGVNGINGNASITNGHAHGANGHVNGTNGHINGINGTKGHTQVVNGHTNGSNGVNGETTGADWEIGTLLKKRVPIGVH